MNVRVHIDRLVLDGLDVSAADRPRLQAALEAELTRLVASGGLAPSLAAGTALPSLRVPNASLPPQATPSQVGTAIAGAVYGGVGSGGVASGGVGGKP